MGTVTISKKEYRKLMEIKFRYEHLRAAINEDVFAPPPTNKAEEIMKSFAAERKYGKRVLSGLKKGLERSSFFKK